MGSEQSLAHEPQYATGVLRRRLPSAGSLTSNDGTQPRTGSPPMSPASSRSASPQSALLHPPSDNDEREDPPLLSPPRLMVVSIGARVASRAHLRAHTARAAGDHYTSCARLRPDALARDAAPAPMPSSRMRGSEGNRFISDRDL